MWNTTENWITKQKNNRIIMQGDLNCAHPGCRWDYAQPLNNDLGTADNKLEHFLNSTRGHSYTQQEHTWKDKGCQAALDHVIIWNHCFWQASDSVCTTVLTVTLSKQKNGASCGFFCPDVHNKLENDLETNNKQTNVCDLTMRTLVMHTHTLSLSFTHTHTHTHVVRVCVSVCVYMCVCVRGRVCVGRWVCVWVGGCM